MARPNAREEKVLLKDVTTLTFQEGKLTKARRSKPIPQLDCRGSACKLYRPPVVQCTNMGSDGTDSGVQWKCEADLPSSLRLGEIEVSCEGWSAPGDRYVLRGSCGLDYSLSRVDPGLEGGGMGYSKPSKLDWPGIFFILLFTSVLTYILWGFIKSIFRAFFPSSTSPRLNPQGGRGSGSSWWPGGGGGGGPGGFGGGGGPGFGGGPASGPPPPYSKATGEAVPPAAAGAAANGWTGPGFWTGLGLGGLGAYMAANAGNRQRQDDRLRQDRRWDAFRRGGQDINDYGTGFGVGGGGGGFGDRRGGGARDTADLGEVRRATGFGGTNVR